VPIPMRFWYHKIEFFFKGLRDAKEEGQPLLLWLNAFDSCEFIKIPIKTDDFS
jgi:hypothetical protein